jgi:hypothetical protein
MTISEDHPTAWYAEMSSGEKNTFWACTGGWMLDAMDVQMFSFAIPAIIGAFAITNSEAGLIGTATLLSSALGGWFAGALSDRLGRVRTLQMTIAWFALFTFLCGFAQTYTQLFVLRALMGLGFGGEWAAAAVLVGEVIRAEHRGKAVGAMQSGWAIGAFAACRDIILQRFFAGLGLARTALSGLTPACSSCLCGDLKRAAIAAETGRTDGGGQKVNFLEIFTVRREHHNPDLLTQRVAGGYARYDVATDVSRPTSSRFWEPEDISPSSSWVR